MSEDSSKGFALDRYESPSRKLIKTKDKKNNSLGNPYLVILKTFLIFICSQLAALIIVAFGQFIYSLSTHNGSTYSAAYKEVSTRLENSAVLQFFYILIAESILILSVYGLLKLRKKSFRSIGINRLPIWKDAKRALLAFGLYYLLVLGAGIIISVFIPGLNTNQNQDVGFKSLGTGEDQLLAFISLVMLAPVAEEILMRGYLFTALRSKWNLIPTAMVISLIFGLAHLQSGDNSSVVWLAAVNTFLLSLVLVYLREKTGALYASIMLHSLNNLVAYAVHFHPSIF
jgi:membrane protease YdiL (CAAX protease family)